VSDSIRLRDAEAVAAFVLREGARVHGARLWCGRGGRGRDGGDGGADARGLGGALEVLSARRVRGLSEAGRAAVIGLARGSHVAVVAERPFAPREVLALQAEGRRCVSLLPPGAPLGPYATTFAFCIHDIEHLAKFFDPPSHRAQVGFFRLLHGGISAGLGGLLARHDARFSAELDAVGADTNGSPVFAFAAVVMKLKMATRRALGRAQAEAAHSLGKSPSFERTRGALTAEEEAAFLPEFEALAEALRVPRALRAGALTVGARGDDRAAARALFAHFAASAPTAESSGAQAEGGHGSSPSGVSSPPSSPRRSPQLSSVGASEVDDPALRWRPTS